MRKLSFQAINRAIKKLKLMPFDLVIGIGKGGIGPACLIAHKIGCDLKIIQINYRDQDNIPKYRHPKIINKFSIPQRVKRILIVDDVAVSGKTLKLAKKVLGDCRSKTLTLIGNADYVVFPKIKSCVKWPWQNSPKISCK